MTPRDLLAAAPCLTLTLVTLGYLALCVIDPFGRCRTCHGTGRKRSPLTRMRRECRRCAGTGLRLRLGRHAINHIKDEYKAAK
ncbi:zinc finger-like domain-containing protein [Micromonospora rubida]|uniref:zinc finger-like domain-containing protein n=1 Tax=Micromonospora rubida TaxID=2697657 RepID=UPI0013767209|nr:zinc finger-like domain-containing protein [Micromonospora rubida]NBE82172.1 hypothetical protein [Micromonospora rubida]